MAVIDRRRQDLQRDALRLGGEVLTAARGSVSPVRSSAASTSAWPRRNIDAHNPPGRRREETNGHRVSRRVERSTGRRAIGCSSRRSSCAARWRRWPRRRRELPPGGAVPEDYVFQGAGADGAPTDVRLSELFAPGKDSLAIYSFMFPRDPGDERPGPASGQTALLPLDGGPVPVVRRAARPARRRRRARQPAPQPRRRREGAAAARLLDLRRGARLAAAAAAVLGRQHLQPRLPRRDARREHSGRC